jgi:hypothetical protein
VLQHLVQADHDDARKEQLHGSMAPCISQENSCHTPTGPLGVYSWV